MDLVLNNLQRLIYKFDKHLKKARGHIDRNVVEIIKMKTLNDKNHQASSEIFRQLVFLLWKFQCYFKNYMIEKNSNVQKYMKSKNYRFIKL